MIEVSNIVQPSLEQMMFIIRGMRNPMNSWDRIDSGECGNVLCSECSFNDHQYDLCKSYTMDSIAIGDKDRELMRKLCKGGEVHRKYMRQIPVFMEINAPLYWWKEFDTYKIGTTSNSCSTMHKIHSKPFTLDDFSHEHLEDYKDNTWGEVVSTTLLENTIICLNQNRDKFLETKDKKYWWQMIQLLPSSYNQKRSISLNYEVLANIYKWRNNHKLDEWKEFCTIIKNSLNLPELVTGEID